MSNIEKAIEELVAKKNSAITSAKNAVTRLEEENFQNGSPSSDEDIKEVFGSICKFMKIDRAITHLKDVDNVDYSDLDCFQNKD